MSVALRAIPGLPTAAHGARTYDAICRSAAGDPEILGADGPGAPGATAPQPPAGRRALPAPGRGCRTPWPRTTTLSPHSGGTEAAVPRGDLGHRIQGLLPGPPGRAAGTRRHRAAPRPTRSVAAPSLLPALCAIAARTATGNPSACSTWAPPPASTCCSIATPTPTGQRATGLSSKPVTQPQGSLLECTVRGGLARSPRRSAAAAGGGAERGSIARPSTPPTKPDGAGSWPACGPTTCPASPGCGPRWTSPAPIHTLPVLHRGDMVDELADGGRERGTGEAPWSSSIPGSPRT